METQDIMNKIEFKDITAQIDQLVAGLSSGEMFSSQSFSLYDSMSATELGDPKMDYKYGLKDVKSIHDYKIQAGSELSIGKIIGIYD